ncbi:hypothetical protein ElyMa_001290400 [Elysia marginata]|uniref:VWFA domain-containing protein n=1 Tax=Elysia marginata TaxID=1093978 RepID=A0AAV4IHJ8_9GAST|nr:hypothetical protein ElyMa_001290400 [Elysia marginata]
MAILVVDDTNKDLHLFKPEVKLLKRNNVKVAVVAVGEVPEPTIRFLASNPDEHVIRVSGYDSFKDNGIDVLYLLCGLEEPGKYHTDVKYYHNDQGSQLLIKAPPTPDMTKTTENAKLLNSFKRHQP